MADTIRKPIESSDSSLIGTLFQEILQNPLNLVLVGIIAFLVYKIIKSRQTPTFEEPPVPELPKIRRDFILEELKQYNGFNEDGRILIAVNGNVYDVTKGKKFYGPGGPYSAFAGRDASRGLATFSVDSAKEEYDDLSDLNSMEMESVREWDTQFREKYEFVGKLLKPGEEPTNYSDEEEEKDNSKKSSENKKKE